MLSQRFQNTTIYPKQSCFKWNFYTFITPCQLQKMQLSALWQKASCHFGFSNHNCTPASERNYETIALLLTNQIAVIFHVYNY
jgi:hypothetical protein